MDGVVNPESPRPAGAHRVVEQKVVAPFLRWAGSKRRLVPELLEWMPAQMRAYHEPFMGSAALFFARKPLCQAFLTDANTCLTRTFSAIREDVDAVIVPLRAYATMYERHGAAFYDHVRAQWSEDMSDPDLAATFIFFNKTNFNGIWRVNASGGYNVPAGKFERSPAICDENALRACSKALAMSTIVNSDFRAVETRAGAGDFVYFDSPYIPVSDTADFTAYTREGFTRADQTALRDLALRLKKRQVNVVLSNSDTPTTRELYAGFELRQIERRGGMNSDVTKRQAVAELLIR